MEAGDTSGAKAAKQKRCLKRVEAGANGLDFTDYPLGISCLFIDIAIGYYGLKMGILAS